MPDSPYKFLDFYTIHDRDIFFGRERETRIFVADVLINRLVVLFARTGTGKTSLINAGVRPRLEARDFATFYVRVEQDPIEAARDVLIQRRLLDTGLYDASLPEQLVAVVKSLNKPVVLFFDQFEEFFIQIADRGIRNQFITDIARVYQNTESGVHVVFSMREEYFHEMDDFRTEIPSIFHQNSNLRLQPFDEDQAREAIIKPAEARGVRMMPDLVDELVKDLAQDEAIGPTRLQIVCDTLWRDPNRAGDRITKEDYLRLGQANHIYDLRLKEDIERALSTPEHLDLMEKLLPELHTEQNTKYPRLLSDLVHILDTDKGMLKELVSRLKKIHVIREIAISGADAIEWTSDYLAERTHYLTFQVKAIGLKRLLQAAITKAQETRETADGSLEVAEPKKGRFVVEADLDTLYLPVEDFERLSKGIEYLPDLNSKEAAFLFEAALFHGDHLMLWYDQALRLEADPLDILHKKIHSKEVHINQRLGSVTVLAEIGTEQAVSLLEQALAEPDLALAVVDTVGDIPEVWATNLLGKALERDDLWDVVVLSLTRSRMERAVTLLIPYLQQDERVSQAKSVLMRLATTAGGQLAHAASAALEKSSPIEESTPELIHQKTIPVEFPETSPREWDQLISQVKSSRLTPIIGSRMSHSLIAKKLADEYEYPFQNRDNLARVAEYVSITTDWSYPKDVMARFLPDLEQPEIVESNRTLDILAKLPLPLYITTGFDDRMSQALVKAGKSPRQDYCRWNTPRVSQERVEDDFLPSVQEPVVYHLHGILDEPKSLVLTEKDHVEFLIQVSALQDVLPHYLRKALMASGMVFLDFVVDSLDFRTTLGLIDSASDKFQKSHYRQTVVLQPPDEVTDKASEHLANYLKAYCERLEMRIYWGPPLQFAQELEQHWKEYM